ncbi:MAG: ArsR/SmtB family transcription factor [Candidatus Thorarchaeota archaeon]|jgi:predicted transcriptional regulator
MGPDEETSFDFDEPKSLEALAKILSILGNETRLKVIAALQDGKMFIQELSQSLGVSYPLLHLHLKNLESNGIVRSEYSVGSDKSRRYVKRYFELVDFNIEISPDVVAKIAKKELKDKKRKE